MRLRAVWFLGRVGAICLLVLNMGCTEGSGDRAQAEQTARAAGIEPAKELDRTTRPGRTFVYLDAAGVVKRTSRYDDIPEALRGAVLVDEGGRPGRVQRVAGGIRVEALPPRITVEERAGMAAAEQALRAAADGGPPSTEGWNDEQWREELKREMEELRREQAESE